MSGSEHSLTFRITGEEALAELPHLLDSTTGKLLDFDRDQAIREENRAKIAADPLARRILEAVLRHHRDDGCSIVHISNKLGDAGALVGHYLGSLSDHALATAARSGSFIRDLTVEVPIPPISPLEASSGARATAVAPSESGTDFAIDLTQEDFIDTVPLLYDGRELVAADGSEYREKMQAQIDSDDVARSLLRFAVDELHHRQGIPICELRASLMKGGELVGDFLSGLLYDATREELLTNLQGRLPRSVSVPTGHDASEEAP